MKPLKIIILVVLIAVFSVASSEAGWLVYHKPEFKGKVIDAETKQPIVGAVFVVVYNKTTMGLGAGTLSSIINVRETLTDKDGVFRIPSYTTLIQPFSWASGATFIVFKPGYACISGLNLEEILSKDTNKKQVELPWMENKDLKFIFASRFIALPKLKTREERLNALRSADKIVDVRAEGISTRKIREFIKLLNTESVDLGLTPYKEVN